MSEALRRGIVIILGALAMALVIVPALPPVNEKNTEQSAFCFHVVFWGKSYGTQCTATCYKPAVWPNPGFFFPC